MSLTGPTVIIMLTKTVSHLLSTVNVISSNVSGTYDHSSKLQYRTISHRYHWSKPGTPANHVRETAPHWAPRIVAFIRQNSCNIHEVFFHRRTKNSSPRIETRQLVSHSTPCASPRMMIAGKAGAKVKVKIEFLGGKHHLPILYVERI